MCFSKNLTFTLSFVIDFIVTNGIAFTVVSTMVVLAQAVITAFIRSTFIFICVFRRQIRYGLTKFVTFNLCGCSPRFFHQKLCASATTRTPTTKTSKKQKNNTARATHFLAHLFGVNEYPPSELF